MDVGPDATELYARLFHGETVYDLSQLLTAAAAARWQRLNWAIDINDRGQVVGYGTRADGSLGAFLATPVPEAPAAFTLLAGLGVLGAVLRTRRRQPSRRSLRPELLVASPTFARRRRAAIR